MKKQFLKYYFMMAALSLAACDPGLSGDAKIFNECGQTLKVRYIKYQSGKADTVSVSMNPDETLTIQVFSGLGDKSDFTCCPFDRIVSISANSGPIKKKSLDCESWQIPNKDKLKRFGGDPIKCEFHVKPEDL